jgi:hypothetical protein
MELPAALRTWFVVHFFTDLLFAVPLLLFPGWLLGLLGWSYVDPVSSRLVGAALLAIGVQSWRTRAAGAEVYRAMLGLKIIWSLGAIFALLMAIAQGAPAASSAFLAIFIAFSGVWIHYAVRLRQQAAAPPDTEEVDAEKEEEEEEEPQP